MDLVQDILDEIGLEGLDGITIDGLWIRLEERPKFLFADRIDSETREFLWNHVRRMQDVEFYRLPKPRNALILDSRYIVEAELGITSEANPPPEDIYPHEVVQDTENKIIGSCASYKTRKNVTKVVRKLNLNLAYSIFGNSLVIVASQEVRRHSLIGSHSNPDLDIGGPQYCMLERIGRSRSRGEPTQGKTGLQAMGEDPKTIFYYRKGLLKHNLITKQLFQLKLLGNNVSGLLLHLTRFYKLVKPKFVSLTENVVKLLKDQPNCMVDYNVLRDYLIIPGVLRRLTKIGDFQKFVRSDIKVPYRTLYPDADIRQWKQKATDKEKKIRVVQLRDVNIDIRDVQKKLFGNDEDEDDDDDKGCGILVENNRFFDVPLLTQCCIVIKNAGRSGMTQSDVGRSLGLSRVQARTVCKNVVKTGAVGCFMTDVGRQRVSKFYLKHFDDLNSNMEAFIEEKVTEFVNTREDIKMITIKKPSTSDETDDSLILDSCINNHDKEVSTRVLENEFIVSRKNKFEISYDTLNESEGIVNSTVIESDGLSCIDDVSYLNEISLNSGRNSLEMINNDSLSSETNSHRDDNNMEVVDSGSDVINYKNDENSDVSRDDLSKSRKRFGEEISVKNKKRKTSDYGKQDYCSSNKETVTAGVCIDKKTQNVKENCTDQENVIDQNNSIDKAESNLDKNDANRDKKDENSDKNDTNFDKIHIDVSITDDFQWLLTEEQYRKEINRLRLNNQIACKSLKTYRLLKRSNLIMETVHENKVINDIRKLVLIINEAEYKEGEACRMDKKSLLRILFRLALDKHIKIYRVTLKSGVNFKYLDFICDNKVESDDPLIKSAVEFARLKFQSSLANNGARLSTNNGQIKKLQDIESRKMATYYPKFNRMKVIHRFLFYLVYNYEGQENMDQDLAKLNLKKDCELTDDVVDLMSFIYYPKIDWKMFIPPLPKYAKEDESNGWCLLSDILVRLPLSLFTQLVHVPYYCPDIDSYLEHPIKRHLLVSKLPVKMRNCLNAGRKYIFTIFETMSRLAYIGLLQFGPHLNKEKEQVFSYVNRNATLLDTTLSKLGYNKISTDNIYPVKKYKFNSLLEVDDYWINAMNICMNTRLGARCLVLNTDVVLENVQDKQDMINAMKPHEFSEAASYDIGYTPGDKLGAAGYDSALFAHLKRNWHSKTGKNITEKKPIKTADVNEVKNVSNKLNLDKVSSNSSSQVQHQQLRLANTIKKRKRTVSSSSTVSLPRKISIIKQTRVKPNKQSVKIRHIKPKKSLVRRPYYDQIDKEALKQMSKLRVDWSQEEDRILLICKIASAFICPDTRKQINANMFLAFREVLHNTVPSSKNKTSRACQRRVAYMLRSSNTSHNVNLCVEELRQDEDIMNKYGGTVEYIQNEATLRGKKIKELENLWKKRFKELVTHLIGRYNYNFNNFTFNMSNRFNENFVIPNSLEEFHKVYNLLSLERSRFKSKGKFKCISCSTDIYCAVLNVTIHSTLCCNSDKTSWSYHLFSIYQQYPEKLLRSVLSKMRSSQMVSFKKSYQTHRLYSANYLPLSASPYQLSISYINLMQTKYQPELYIECYNLFSDLLKSLTASDISDKKGFKVLSLCGGSTATIVQLFSNNYIDFHIDIPDQIIVLDPNVKNKDETYARLVKRYQDILTNYKKDLTCSILFQKDNYTGAMDESSLETDNCPQENDDEESNSPVETTALFQQNVVAKAASRIALYLMRDDIDTTGMVPKEMDHAHDFFVVNSCNIYVKFRKKFVKENNNFYDDNLIDGDEIKNIFENIRKLATFNTTSHTINDVNHLNKLLSDIFCSEEIDLVKLILNKIEIKKEFGLTNSELISDFGNSFKILGIVNKLIEENLILCTGCLYTRYVHYLYVRPWLLHSYRNVRVEKDSRVPISQTDRFKLTKKQMDNYEENYVSSDFDEKKVLRKKVNDNISTDSNQPCTSKENEPIMVENFSSSQKNEAGTVFEDTGISDINMGIQDEDYKKLINHNMSHPIKVVVRPWIRVDGTLNRRVIDMILTSVLNHIMLHPGVSLYDVQQRFSPAYLPHHIREVCDILIKLKCLCKYRILTNGKPSLNSKPCPVIVDDSPTGLELESEIRYESTKFAIINLGKLIETKPYSQDFIKCLLGK